MDSNPAQAGTNGVNGNHGPKPLQFVIVGAGIGGLSTAIFLRQQGHHVTILEQSRFSSEVGAAVHIAPNANGLLKRMGLDIEAAGAVPCNDLVMLKPSGEITINIPLWRSKNSWQHLWVLGHRVDLHAELMRLATTEEGQGHPAILKTSSKVTEVTTDGSVTLASGEVIKADVVVGADGVHSNTRYALPGSKNIKAFCSGKSAFRFTMPYSRAFDDPVTRPIVEGVGRMVMYMGHDRRIVVYPTRHGTMLNFVCIHPTECSAQSAGAEASSGWETNAGLESLLEVYKDFEAPVVKLLSMADNDSLKVWELLDMDQLPTWTEDKLVLIGDAAHPFTPHQGQGAGQAIEDGASLACLLPLGTPIEEIPERLKLYEKCRYTRASAIQEYSRIAGRDLGEGPPLDTFKYTNENFGHDEWHYTSQKLREWEWSRKPNAFRRMPLPFGPTPGPRQDHLGNAHDWSKATFTTASIKFKTSRTLLQNLFPTQAFEFHSADTNCFATFSMTTLGNLKWLGGRGYNHFGLYIHGVDYTKENGEKVHGTYLPILFENLADPIISGREELGMPKVFSSLDVTRIADSWRLTAGWMGNNFLDISMSGLAPKAAAPPAAAATGPPPGPPGPPGGPPGGAPGGPPGGAPGGPPGGAPGGPPRGPPPPPAEQGLLFYKYVPATGPTSAKSRGADAEYAAMIPNEEEAKAPKVVERTLVADKADIRFDKLDWEKLPTLHHIVDRLAEIPIYEIMEAKVVEGTGMSDVRGARRIE